MLQFTLGTGGEGPGNLPSPDRHPAAQVSFLAYGFLRINIADNTIAYRFIDEQGHIRDEIGRTIQR